MTYTIMVHVYSLRVRITLLLFLLLLLKDFLGAVIQICHTGVTQMILKHSIYLPEPACKQVRQKKGNYYPQFSAAAWSSPGLHKALQGRTEKFEQALNRSSMGEGESYYIYPKITTFSQPLR